MQCGIAAHPHLPDATLAVLQQRDTESVDVIHHTTAPYPVRGVMSSASAVMRPMQPTAGTATGDVIGATDGAGPGPGWLQGMLRYYRDRQTEVDGGRAADPVQRRWLVLGSVGIRSSHGGMEVHTD